MKWVTIALLSIGLIAQTWRVHYWREAEKWAWEFVEDSGAHAKFISDQYKSCAVQNKRLWEDNQKCHPILGARERDVFCHQLKCWYLPNEDDLKHGVIPPELGKLETWQ